MVRFSLKKLLYALFIIISCGKVVQYATTHTSFAPLWPEQKEVSAEACSHFENKINEYETHIWDLLKTDTHVTKDDCLLKHKKSYQQYQRQEQSNATSKEKRYPALRQETVECVQNIVREFDIDPATIKVVPFKGQGSPAAAEDNTIFIDEPEFCHYSPQACKFFIGHEIAHMKAHDASLYRAVETLIHAKPKVSNQKKKHALNAYSRFIETRADTNTLLAGGKEYAQGAFEFLYKLKELDGGDNPGITHPKTSDRIKNVEELCSLMKWEIPKTYA